MKSLENERRQKKKHIRFELERRNENTNTFSSCSSSLFRLFRSTLRCVGRKLEVDATMGDAVHTPPKPSQSQTNIERKAHRIYMAKKWAAVSISKRIVVAVDFANANIVFVFVFVGRRCIDVYAVVAAWARDLLLFQHDGRAATANLKSKKSCGKWAKRYWNGKAWTDRKNELLAIYAKREKKFKYFSIAINLAYNNCQLQAN